MVVVCIVVADIVMAYIVLAHSLGMAYIVMADDRISLCRSATMCRIVDSSTA